LAFDLLELDGRDLRREPIEERKRLLAKLLKGAHSSIVLNEHFEGDGAAVYRAPCQLGCEGIVSKRLVVLSARTIQALDQNQEPPNRQR
jgi:bifunctional non-homologous end joining protein LigD